MDNIGIGPDARILESVDNYVCWYRFLRVSSDFYYYGDSLLSMDYG
jgi:hypothetical protein